MLLLRNIYYIIFLFWYDALLYLSYLLLYYIIYDSVLSSELNLGQIILYICSKLKLIEVKIMVGIEFYLCTSSIWYGRIITFRKQIRLQWTAYLWNCFDCWGHLIYRSWFVYGSILTYIGSRFTVWLGSRFTVWHFNICLGTNSISGYFVDWQKMWFNLKIENV